MNLKDINQQIKKATRRVKDLLLPWRKKRREQWLHVGQQIGLLHVELSETNQSISESKMAAGEAKQAVTETHQFAATVAQSVQDLAQQIERNQSRSREENSLNLTRQRMQFQGVHQRIDKLALQSEQLQSHVEHTDDVRNQYQNSTLLQLKQQDQAIARSFDQQNRLELRLVELEKEVILLKEPVATNCSMILSLQTKLVSTVQRVEENHVQIDKLGNSVAEIQQQQFAQQQAAALQQAGQSNATSPPSLQQRVVAGIAKVRAIQAAPTNPQSQFCPASFDYYSRFNDDSPFVYLDVKSIPRSGLHYLQQVLGTVLGKALSFCEWYQEPGCCKQMPCAVTGFAQACCELGRFGVRMIKSHDFDLADPIFPTTRALRRIILIRDPVYCLTSYWNLQALKYNQELLKANGINPVKVDYLHEKPVLQMAYRLIDAQGSMPSEAELVKFLEQTKKYMLGFIGKWGRHVPEESIIAYDNVHDFAIQFLEGLSSRLSTEARERFEALSNQTELAFSSRTNPFASMSQRLSEHLSQYAELFQQVSDEIKMEDESGWLARCCTLPENSGSAAGDANAKQLRIAS